VLSARTPRRPFGDLRHDLADAVTSKSVMMRMAKKSTVRQPSLEPFAVT
jgi:hypothetical protein